MQSNTIRRLFGYGLGAGVAATLAWLGLTATLAPDADHYLLQAEIKLRYATCLPGTQESGAPVAARELLIRDAEDYLARAESLGKDLPVAAEYRGYIHYLRGDARAAAASYRRAGQLLASDAREAQGELRVNEARMLVLAGDDPAALATLREPCGVVGHARPAADLESARILKRMGCDDDALAAARAAALAADSKDSTWVDAGELLEALGDHATAASVYERMRASQPLANYLAARLKAQAGAFDIAFEMLERAVEGMGPEVYRLLARDAEAWRHVSTTARFQSLFPKDASARPGR